MKRDLQALANQEFDVLIIGGGIHGCCAARDAALRGLSVALVEKNDFVSATSANSQKTIHGGLRYLQKLDVRRMRESVQERRAMLKIAPHLIAPMPCLLPTYGLGMKSKPALFAGMLLNDVLSLDRNNSIEDKNQRIPRGKLLSRNACLEILDSIDPKGVTGAALWFDAQMYNSERVALSFLIDACEHGAVVANYAEATKLSIENGSAYGAKIKDSIGGEEFEIRAKVVLNCVGDASDQILVDSGLQSQRQYFKPSTAMNLVIKRDLYGEFAAGLRHLYAHEQSDGTLTHHSRVFFVSPWRGHTLVGTRHYPLGEGPLALVVTEDKIESFLQEINETIPGAKLQRDDVVFWHWGIIPMDGINPENGEFQMTAHPKYVDHKENEGIDNLLSIVGVKYTTGRLVAEKGIDLVLEKLGRKKIKSTTATTALPGGDIESLDSLINEISTEHPDFSDKVVYHLARNYGSLYKNVVALGKENSEWLNVIVGSDEAIGAEVIHAIRNEMAITLSDVLLRRTDIGTLGHPGDETLKAVADLMAAECNWSKDRQDQELEAATNNYIIQDIKTN